MHGEGLKGVLKAKSFTYGIWFKFTRSVRIVVLYIQGAMWNRGLVVNHFSWIKGNSYVLLERIPVGSLWFESQTYIGGNVPDWMDALLEVNGEWYVMLNRLLNLLQWDYFSLRKKVFIHDEISHGTKRTLSIFMGGNFRIENCPKLLVHMWPWVHQSPSLTFFLNLCLYSLFAFKPVFVNVPSMCF